MRAILAFVAVIVATGACAQETIEIPQGERSLRAVLYKPEGAGPFPTVVALHGCRGLASRQSPIAAHYQEWGEKLRESGFAVIFPDSFGFRGLASQCRVRDRNGRAAQQRVVDVTAARRWLQEQPWVVKERISLVGWSTGGSTVLWAVRPHVGPNDGKPDFRSAVAFYPACRRLRDAAWSARVPTLVLAGGADDWSPARYCQQMIAGARGRSALASIMVYPGAYQDFDRANVSVHERRGMAFSADGSGRVHVGTNPAARADAFRRVPQWLAR